MDQIDALIRDLTKIHTDSSFLSKADVRGRLEVLVAGEVLKDRLSFRTAAHADAKAELIEALMKHLPLGRSDKGEIIAILKSLQF